MEAEPRAAVAAITGVPGAGRRTGEVPGGGPLAGGVSVKGLPEGMLPEEGLRAGPAPAAAVGRTSAAAARVAGLVPVATAAARDVAAAPAAPVAPVVPVASVGQALPEEPARRAAAPTAAGAPPFAARLATGMRTRVRKGWNPVNPDGPAPEAFVRRAPAAPRVAA